MSALLDCPELVEALLGGWIIDCNCNYLRVQGKKDRNRIMHSIAGWQALFKSALVQARAILDDRVASVVDGCD